MIHFVILFTCMRPERLSSTYRPRLATDSPNLPHLHRSHRRIDKRPVNPLVPSSSVSQASTGIESNRVILRCTQVLEIDTLL